MQTGSNSDGIQSPATACFDIESYDSTMHEWQKVLVKGFSSKEMVIFTAGRNTGKSVLNSAEFHKLWKDVFDKTPKPISDLILSESRVHGSVYHCVEPVDGHWPDMDAWSRQTYGEPGEFWTREDFMWPEQTRWFMNDRKFWFRNLKDRDWFIMRWRA